MAISAKEVCKQLNELNSNEDGFIVGLLAKFYVTDKLANDSKVACSKLEGAEYYSSSALGIINALTDETIGYSEDEDKFILVSSIDEKENKVWDKYESDVDAFNKEHGTNHMPDDRPSYLKRSE
jgi:hypothetical protein